MNPRTLVIALVAVGLTWLLHSSIADAIGSIVIGLLLCAIGSVLAAAATNTAKPRT